MTDTFTILIVDDNANNLFTLHTLLNMLLDCQVLEASSGEQALIMTLKHEIHLILLDVQMPVMDGFDTAKHLKMTHRTRHIPIVFITAVFKESEFRRRGYVLGAVDYLTKPIDDNQLLNRIQLYQQIFDREQALRKSNIELEQRVYARTAELEWQTQALEAEIQRHQHTEKALLKSQHEHQQIFNSLKESEERFRRFFENNASVMLMVEPNSCKIINANASAGLYYGYELAELRNMLIYDLNLSPLDAVAEQQLKLSLKDQHHYIFQHRAANEETRDVEIYSTPIQVDGQTILFCIVHDITQRKQAEEKLQLAANVFSHAREGIIITDAQGTIIDTNEAFAYITGYRRDEIIGKNPSLLRSGRHDANYYKKMWATLLEQGHWSGEVWNRHKSGRIYAEMLTISAVKNQQDETQYYVGLFSDITELKQHQDQLEHIAHYDALTNLPNRVLLAKRLQQGMEFVKKQKKQLIVVYIDLDGFKAINDNHGHEIGDQLLMVVAKRMQSTLRDNDTVSRIGGDEFVAVLLNLDDSSACINMLQRLLKAAAKPVHIDNKMLHISASLGVTYFPQIDMVDADQLLRQADQAMYQAKLLGKNCYHIFDAALDRSVRGHHESIDNIRTALKREEFVLYYQPRVNMRTGKVIGAEALIRWQHPEQGLLTPATFLPIIENHPLEIELGDWVLKTALTQLSAWQQMGLDLSVSVNVSALQLQQPNFTERLTALIKSIPHIEARLLELEILENSALEDIVQISQVMQACKGLGISFSLDDFGTGYSTLTYIKRLPASILKIDQSFVHDMLDDPEDLAIIEGVLGLATAFRRQAVAEGVETDQHAELLLQLGCELAQGYGISRPIPSASFLAWMETWRPTWTQYSKVSREDLPVLFAGAEHRAWIRGITYYIHDNNRGLIPPIKPNKCRFGEWLHGEGKLHYGESSAFKEIKKLHHEVHRLGESLLLNRNIDKTEQQTRLQTLYLIRDNLLKNLQKLLD